MVEVGTIETKLTAESEEFEAALKRASDALGTFANSADGAAKEVTRATGDMESGTRKAADGVKDSTESMGRSLKNVVVGFSSIATAGFALYQTFDNIEKREYALQKANLALDKANRSVDAAQLAYNQTLLEAGTDGTAAADATDALREAQNKAKDAASTLADAQQHYNDILNGYPASSDEAKNATERLDDAKWNLRATNHSLEEAEDSYNAAVTEYGATSDQATAAEWNLESARHSQQKAIENVDEAQQQYDKTMKGYPAESGEAKKATNDLESAQRTNEDAINKSKEAQDKFNKAINTTTADSPEVKKALEDLQIAQAAQELASERQDLAQKNVNDSMTQAALFVVPSVITGVDGLFRAFKGLKDLDIGSHLGAVKDAIHAIGGTGFGAIGPLITGAASLGFMFAAMNEKGGQMKQVYGTIAGVMAGVTAAQWAWNIAQSVGLGLTGVGLITVAAAVAAGVAMYALSQSLGNGPSEASGTGQIGTVGAAGTTASGGGGGTTGATPSTSDVDLMMAQGNFKRDEVAFYVQTDGNGVQWYMWEEPGAAYGKLVSKDQLDDARRKRGQGTAEQNAMYPWIFEGYEGGWGSNGLPTLIGVHLAGGGLVMEPTLAAVGEAGKEAVLPLEDPAAMREIADAINAGSGGRSVTNNFYITKADPEEVAREAWRLFQAHGGRA